MTAWRGGAAHLWPGAGELDQITNPSTYDPLAVSRWRLPRLGQQEQVPRRDFPPFVLGVPEIRLEIRDWHGRDALCPVRDLAIGYT
jgi:hypothetical protein